MRFIHPTRDAGRVINWTALYLTREEVDQQPASLWDHIEDVGNGEFSLKLGMNDLRTAGCYPDLIAAILAATRTG